MSVYTETAARAEQAAGEFVLVAGDIRLDPSEGRLWRGGTMSPLSARPLSLLAELMSAPQTLVTKDDLFARVWDGRVLSEAVLTTAVKQVRQAIGDDARSPAYIETVHGRGYRFIKPVDRIPRNAAAGAGPPARPRQPWLRIAPAAITLMAAAVAIFFALEKARAPHPKSIAVLPLVEVARGEDRDWFAEGMTEEIVATLSRTPDLVVASRRAAAELTKGGLEPREVGRRLDVAHVVEGSVREDEGRLRISVRLVRTRDGVQVWAENFDRPATEAIDIQQAVAFDIARMLDTVLDPDRLRAMFDAGTRSPEAYDAYLESLAFTERALQAGSLEYAQRSAAAIDRARTIDPDFSRAHWISAQNWYVNSTRVDSAAVGSGLDEAERRSEYFKRLEAAIATSASEVDALKYRSARAAMRVQLRPAHELMKRYLRERPRDIEAWDQFASLSAYVGERPSIAKAAERVHRLSMMAGEPLSRAVTISVMSTDLAAAARRAREQLAINPDNALTNYQAHRAFIWSGDLASAKRSLEVIRSSSMAADSKLLAEIRQACAEGRSADARMLGTRMDAVGTTASRWHAAKILGDDAGARRLLEPFDDAAGFSRLVQFLLQPNFDPREFPAFAGRLEVEGVSVAKAIITPGRCKP